MSSSKSQKTYEVELTGNRVSKGVLSSLVSKVVVVGISLLSFTFWLYRKLLIWLYVLPGRCLMYDL